MANNVGNSLWGAADARASGYQQRANISSQAASGLGGLFNDWYSNNSAANGGGTGWYLGKQPGKG